MANRQGMLLPLLLENVKDERKGSMMDVAVFSPVGDLGQMDIFYKTVRKLGIADSVDFIFIYRKGLEYPSTGLSALHATEKYPLGTSGCFFAGQALCYLLGYKTVVVADLDSVLDSGATLAGMEEMAHRLGHAVLPEYRIKENTADIASNVNNWGVYPREVFEKAGFSTPYIWKGSEDYEFFARLSHLRMVEIYRDGYYSHHFSGFTVYHKMGEKKKYYPYINGTLKAILFVADYSKAAYFNYCLWYVFYSFFADAFEDRWLRAVVAPAHKFEIVGSPIEDGGKEYFTVKRVKEVGSFSNTSQFRMLLVPYSLVRLALTGKYEVYRDVVELKVSRPIFMLRLLAGAVRMPLRALEAAMNLLQWRGERKKVHFPATPENLESVEKEFAALARDRCI